MNQLTGQKNVVLDRLQQLINAFTQDGPLVQQVMNARLHPATETQRQAMRAQIVGQLQQAYATEAGTPQAEPWYAPQNSTIADDITKIYEAVGPDPIFGWFFGHEHKCTIYDDSYSPYRARLIGHGCIPHLPPGRPDNPPIPFTATNMTTRPDGSGYAISGFALLTLNGPILQVDHINEDGTVWTQETWTRTLAVAA